MGSDYSRPGVDGTFHQPERGVRTKPTMQTSGGNMMGGAFSMGNQPAPIKQMKPIAVDPSELKFDEIVLESNEVDLAEV